MNISVSLSTCICQKLDQVKLVHFLLSFQCFNEYSNSYLYTIASIHLSEHVIYRYSYELVVETLVTVSLSSYQLFVFVIRQVTVYIQIQLRSKHKLSPTRQIIRNEIKKRIPTVLMAKLQLCCAAKSLAVSLIGP